LEALLQHHWWRPQTTALMHSLRPLAALVQRLARWQRPTPQTLPVPVVVVGNLIAGGAGKTPTVMALVAWLQRQGWHPGVVSRGHGRQGADTLEVRPNSPVQQVGDEPLLLRRRSGVPVFVGRQRVAAAQALLRAHPDVDILVSDDGLQHHALPRQAELLVFDERGTGNGRLLPAGPLRQALPAQLAAHQWVLYNAAAPSTALPGHLASRRLALAWPLAAWHQGDSTQARPLAALPSRRWLATAGIAAPERFFSMLEAAGLQIDRLPLPDHHALDQHDLPWPAGTPVLVTEKDATKLAVDRPGTEGVWVLPLDFGLPDALCAGLTTCLGPAPAHRPGH
jgi:tetraacyldisaccharide 4'-kinase